jgi:hypothetical protein
LGVDVLNIGHWISHKNSLSKFRYYPGKKIKEGGIKIEIKSNKLKFLE